jgi:hypothetical protein
MLESTCKSSSLTKLTIWRPQVNICMLAVTKYLAYVFTSYWLTCAKLINLCSPRISSTIITLVSWYLRKNFAIIRRLALLAITISSLALSFHSITMHFCALVYGCFWLLCRVMTKYSFLVLDSMGFRFMVFGSTLCNQLWWNYIWPNISTRDAGNETDGEWLNLEKTTASDTSQEIFRSEVTSSRHRHV